MYARLGASNAAVDAVLTPAGETAFTSWFNNGWVAVTPNAAMAPNGKMEAAKIQCTHAGGCVLLDSIVAPCDDPAYVIFAKKGSGALDANRFGIYNQTRSTNVAFGALNYDTGAVDASSAAGQVSSLPAPQGFWSVISLPPSGTIAKGETMAVYAGFVGDSPPVGAFAYVWGARVLDRAKLNMSSGLSKPVKAALVGAGLALLFGGR